MYDKLINFWTFILCWRQHSKLQENAAHRGHLYTLGLFLHTSHGAVSTDVITSIPSVSLASVNMVMLVLVLQRSGFICRSATLSHWLGKVFLYICTFNIADTFTDVIICGTFPWDGFDCSIIIFRVKWRPKTLKDRPYITVRTFYGLSH